jgi:glycerophosphoryl diester phosphodiesterase
MNFLLLSLIFSTAAFSFDWQGHRGARGLYPENTIGGMREALKYPVTTLELDAVVSRDNLVVVSHEPWMNPEMCVSPTGVEFQDKEINLYKLKYEDILTYDCGSKVHPRFTHQIKINESKPLLGQLIEESEKEIKLHHRQISYNIEIKSTLEEEKAGFQPGYKKFADLVIKEIKKHLPLQRFMIQSFDKRVLKYVHQQYPDVTLSVLEESAYEPEAYLKGLGFTPQVFSPEYTLLKASDVEFFHGQGIKVIPWTINTLVEMERIKSLGIDGMITDYPNLIPSVGQKKCPQNTNLFEGNCVHVPRHGIPSLHNPGWVCSEGFLQRRDRCDKVNVPSHGILKADGKTWDCKPGYERYRSKCKKVGK